MVSIIKLGFIGFGEAASQISLGLQEDGGKAEVHAYDILLRDSDKRPALEDKARRCKVALSESLADLAAEAEIIFSAVVSSVALKVAEEMSPHLNKGHIFVDLNAITPQESNQVAAIIEATGALFVDGAMVGSLKARKHKVPVLLSGRGVETFTGKMAPLGFNFQHVGEEPGTASGNKLIRSVFTKGLAALLIETLTYAQKLGYYEVVVESMVNTLQAEPADLVNRLVTGTMIHSRRRLGELHGSREMLRQAGLDSGMVEATLEVLKKIDELGFDPEQVPAETAASIEMLTPNY